MSYRNRLQERLQKSAEKSAPDTICISMDRFIELVRKETVLNMLRYAYKTMEWYRTEDIAGMIFGPDNKYKS